MKLSLAAFLALGKHIVEGVSVCVDLFVDAANRHDTLPLLSIIFHPHTVSYIRHLLLGSSVTAFTGIPKTSGVSSTTTSALSMSSIKSVLAREILDSRGNPTVEVRSRQSEIRFPRNLYLSFDMPLFRSMVHMPCPWSHAFLFYGFKSLAFLIIVWTVSSHSLYNIH